MRWVDSLVSECNSSGVTTRPSHSHSHPLSLEGKIYQQLQVERREGEDTAKLVTSSSRRATYFHQMSRYFSWGGNSNGLPDSNPKGWPHSNEEDLLERPKRIVRIGGPQIFSFCTNFVKTSKYEMWNFLPKFLLEEFNPKTKVANCYFLLISGLQCIPSISNTGGLPTTLIPLLFVVFVDALFQIFEDISRHRADTKANASVAHRFNPTNAAFEDCKWSELSVGDYILIKTRESIPADVLILSVAEKGEPAQGLCYVETKSLDGETNLKIRTAIPCTLNLIKQEKDLTALRGEVEMEHPNKLIETFNGVIDLGKVGRDPILSSNVLLRGCVLRNTDWIMGLVINTGHDTKIMMSSTTTRSKTSRLETKASDEIKKIIIFLAILCFTGATGQAIWNTVHDVKKHWYLDWDPNPVGFWFIDFFYFFLLHATFIPVSLYVSMSITRYFQSYFMNKDLDMYYEKTDQAALVRTMTLNEELGQISHIFSDKTGTLTCNVMDFRKASINGVKYGVGITEIGKAAWKLQGKAIAAHVLEGEARAKANAVPHVSFYCPNYERDIQTPGPQREKIRLFFRTLAICHDVIPERVDGKIKLSASNPDDEALVCAAEYFGFSFQDRRDKFCVVFNRETNQEEQVEVLSVIEFSSKRKRMSVIVRDIDKQIKILCKGADTVMAPRLKAGQDDLIDQTERDMREFSIEGLRCLYIGYAVIKEKDFQRWNDEYSAVRTDLNQMEKKKKGEPNRIEDLEDMIEQGLILIGATAIEDRLQDGVPECIAELAKAGINIWVLTGDKEETAINIAVACNLVLPKEYMDHIIINTHLAPTADSMKSIIKTEIERYDADLIAEEERGLPTKPRALIIDGPSLIIAMADHSEGGIRDLLLDLSQRCRAVVGCRVSPDQKREMVHLIKTGIEGVRTLAIGDGANDVAMIQEAHIGVGIKGEEGLQAVNSSDYAIAQFRYLSELTLKHGRYNYARMSSLVCYMFYKNILMSIAQFWFNFTCAFSGQKYYTEGAIQLYNLAYTSIPILITGIYDMDVSPKSAHRYPQLYQAGINDEYFKTSLFWKWIFSAVMESVVLSVLPLYTLQNGDYRTGVEETFLQAGATCLTAIVIVDNLKVNCYSYYHSIVSSNASLFPFSSPQLFFIQSRWHWWDVSIIVLSILVYVASLYFITSFVDLDYKFFHVSYSFPSFHHSRFI